MTPERLERIRKQMDKYSVDGLILTNIDNVFYSSGFPGSTATVVLTKERSVIFVDARYILQATKDCPEFEPKLYSGDVFVPVMELIENDDIKKVGFEADNVSFATYEKLQSMLPSGSTLVPTQRLIEDLRYVKEPGEIEKIRAAIAISDETFPHMLGYVKPGMTEREVALEIDVHQRRLGGERPSFDTIAAAGPNAAFPHAKPSDAVIKVGQMLKMDYGVVLNAYKSDITRTIFIGEPDEKQKEVYNVVLEAQLAAIDAIRPGKKGCEIDAVAREYIASKGYGEYFGHGLGHSLGIGVHDGPGLTPTNQVELVPGMVMSVEPGIYIEGWGGVRIEDIITVTETGCEVLSKASKEIKVIK